MDEKRIKTLARDAAVHVIAMCCDTEGFDCVKMDLTKETDATQSLIADAIRMALEESEWPTCQECGGILIFDQEEPTAYCENGCYTTEWGSQANGNHWREVQKKLMARGQRKISSENPGA